MPSRPSRPSPFRGPRFVVVVACAVPLWSAGASAADAKGDAKQACTAAADRGQSLRDEGGYRGARAAFARCAQDDCPRIVARACGDWLRELDGATPTLVLGAKDARGADVSDARVELDGAPLASALDGQPVAADPGPHRLRFTTKDGLVAEERVTLRSGEKNRLVVVTLVDPAAVTVTSTSGGQVDAASEPAASSPRVAVGVTLTVLAVAAAAAGAYFLVESSHQSSVASDLRATLSSSACNGAASGDCAALSDAVDAQHRDVTLGAVALGGAGALALGAIATWVLWKPQPDRPEAAWTIAPSLAPGHASLAVGRSF